MFEDDSSSKIFVFIFSLLLCSFRIDGIIFPFLVISSNYLYLLLHSVERFKKAKIFKKLKYCILGSLIGLIVNIVLNIKFFNSFLPHTALAKRIAYDQDLGFNTLLSNFSKYFIGHKSFLIPIPNNFEFIGIFSPIIIFIIVFFLFRYLLRENKKINSHESNNLNNFLIKLDLGIIGFIYPLVFLGLGKTFVWYYWISALCVNILFICFLDNTLFRYFKNSKLLKICRSWNLSNYFSY